MSGNRPEVGPSVHRDPRMTSSQEQQRSRGGGGGEGVQGAEGCPECPYPMGRKTLDSFCHSPTFK